LANRIIAVFQKELKSEIRNRYSISTIALFALTSVSIIVFSVGNEKFSDSIGAAFIWIIVFFGALTSLAKSFVSEEERGTVLFLKSISDSTSVYFGKLFYNILISLGITLLSILLLTLFNDKIVIRNPAIFWITALLGSLAFASASTIISAIIAKTNAKNTLLVVLSFPILLPNLLLGIESTKMGLEGWEFKDFQENLMLMISYIGLLTTISYFLFDQVWND